MVNSVIHRSQSTLMTCLVEDVGLGKHIHFVDGDDGGYAHNHELLYYEKAFTSAFKALYLLTQWKASWDATNANAMMVHHHHDDDDDDQTMMMPLLMVAAADDDTNKVMVVNKGEQEGRHAAVPSPANGDDVFSV